MAVFDPVKVLTRIIDSLRQIDTCGYFELPVTEDEAPGYYSVIEKPMCLSMMREKVLQRQYRTWGEFLSDFNLMLCNAIHFNDKKSDVYKVAMHLNKEGNERLQEVDLEGRQAIYLSHVGGPASAAIDEANEFQSHRLPIPINPFLVIPTSTPTREAIHDHEQERDDEAEDEYSSFSGTDSEDEGRGLGCPALATMESTLNRSPAKDVVYQLWDKGKVVENCHGVKMELNAGEEWERIKSSFEWRCKWLSFRMREIQNHLDRYSIDLGDEQTEEIMNYRYEKIPIPELATVEHLMTHPFFKNHDHTDHDDLLDIHKDGDDEDSAEGESFPAKIYLSLGILAEEAPKLIALLSARQRISQVRMMPSVGKSIKKMKTPRKKPPSPGMMDTKRPRREFDLDAHSSISFSGGAAMPMEKPLRLDITIPNVIELSSELMEVWKSARQVAKERIELGLDLLLPEDMKSALLLADEEEEEEEEGSSDEDISDEVYLEKHREMELSEKERHLCVFGPTNGKFPKNTEKETKKQQFGQNPSMISSPRPSSRKNRGRSKGHRPVGRPPLTNRRLPPILPSSQMESMIQLPQISPMRQNHPVSTRQETGKSGEIGSHSPPMSGPS